MLGGARLIDHVNRLVGQVAIVDVLGAQFGGGLQGGQGVFHLVVLFKARFQAFENFHGLLDGRFEYVNFLEAPRQGGVFFENTAVFGESGRTDAFELARAQAGLEQIGCVQRAARGRTGANQRVDFVDKKHGIGPVLKRLEHALEALLEITPVFRSGQQGAHVQGIDHGFCQHFGHIFLGNAPGQALGDRGFTHAGFADQQRVVLAAAAQGLDHAFDFVLPANERVNFPVFGELVQVLRELL